MADLQVVIPQVLIPLTGVSEVPDAPRRTLDIRGTDFRSVDEVLINDVVCSFFSILGPQQLLAEVPELVGEQEITDIAVRSNRLTLDSKSSMRFRLGSVVTPVSGILRLVQLFLKILLTSPGRDIFTPNLGGNALKNLGESFGASQNQKVVSEFVVAVDQTTRQIVSLQARDPSIPRDERLLSATVISSFFSAEESALIVSIEVTNQTGRKGVANVVV